MTEKSQEERSAEQRKRPRGKKARAVRRKTTMPDVDVTKAEAFRRANEGKSPKGKSKKHNKEGDVSQGGEHGKRTSKLGKRRSNRRYRTLF